MAFAVPTAANAITLRADISGFSTTDPDWALLGVTPTDSATLWLTFDETNPALVQTFDTPQHLYKTASFYATDYQLEFGDLSFGGFDPGPHSHNVYVRDAIEPRVDPVYDAMTVDVIHNRPLVGDAVMSRMHFQLLDTTGNPDAVDGYDFSDLAALNALTYQSAYFTFFLNADPGRVYYIPANGSGASVTLTAISAVPIPATAPLALGAFGLLALLGHRRRRGR